MARLFGPSIIGVRRLIALRGIRRRAYLRWIRTYEVISAQDRATMADEIASWPARPLISVIMPVYNTEIRWLRAAIESVRAQIYPEWELCISDDASTLPELRDELLKCAAVDQRIKVFFRDANGHISTNSNSALALAHGEFVALLDADDVLPSDALCWVAREIVLHPEVDLLFSDEDKLDEGGRRFDPYFKSAWNPALMLSQNAFSHLGVYRRRLVEEIGRFRPGYEGSHDHDLVLRCAARTASERIRHIPRVLYHRRAIAGSTAPAELKTNAWTAGARAIEDYLKGKGITGKACPAVGGYYQVDYQPISEAPKVSILIPSTGRRELLGPCVSALIERSTYPNFEILLMVGEAALREPSQAAYLRGLERDRRIRVLVYADRAFNYAWVNNWAASQAGGSFLCLMNDDIQIITADWLERLVARAMADDVGAVGPILYYPNNTIQHAGMILGVGGVTDHVFTGRSRGYPGYFGRAALDQDYSCLTGACLLVRRTAFEQVGGLDEAFPIAFNDVDLCLKIRRSGARIVWTPSVEMYHHESVSIGRHDAGKQRQQYLNDLATMRERWQAALQADPCYNPNLSLVGGLLFTLAWPPRTPAPKTAFKSQDKTGISRTSNIMVYPSRSAL